jgi:hypothetical protein
MKAYIPPHAKIDAGTSQEMRQAMFRDWCVKLVEMNQGRFLPLGVKRRWWHLKLEHPLTQQALQ